jgi:hypothetical protein
MFHSSARRAKIRRAGNLLGVLAPLLGALASCGGTATSTPHHENAGTSADAGTPSQAGTDARAGSGGKAAAGSNSGGKAAAGTGGADGAGAPSEGGADDGGAAGNSSWAGAGGESECVDVCALHGPACCVPSLACVASDARCVIEVFDKMVSINYQYADLEQTVAALPPLFLASVSSADVARVASDMPPTARFEMHLSAAASALYGAALENSVMHPFRVSCDGQSLFVGQVYSMIGAAAFQTPVLHVARDADDTIILRFGAWQGGWVASTSPSTLAARERLDRPELRGALCLAGAIEEL